MVEDGGPAGIGAWGSAPLEPSGRQLLPCFLLSSGIRQLKAFPAGRPECQAEGRELRLGPRSAPSFSAGLSSVAQPGRH